MKIAIGNDHAGVDMKREIMEYLKSLGHEVTDLGANTYEKVQYPIYAEKVAHPVANGEYDCGILICGTGAGICIAANKVRGIRAAACSTPTTARLIKEHNNANILCFGARVLGIEVAKDIVRAYLEAKFKGGRHQDRIDLVSRLEEKGSCL